MGKGEVTKTMAIGRMQRYCAYQERCHSEVRSKLLEIGMRGTELEEVIAMLIQEGFLNEERFARLYARSKFRQVQWGRVKIELALKQKQVSDYCIRKGDGRD
jgi:regulatory protein